MNSDINSPIDFIKTIKQQLLVSRYKVSKIANAESLKLYFTIGKLIDDKIKKENWGAKVLENISNQLQVELPGLRGFSAMSLKKMRVFYIFWNTTKNLHDTIWSTVTTKLESEQNADAFLSFSFSHHYEIILKIKEEKNAWYYINKTAREYWSVRHLRTEFKNKSHLQEQIQPKYAQLMKLQKQLIILI